MNGFRLLADSYKKRLQQSELSADERATIEAHIEALEVVADKSEQQLCDIFSTGAFNEILKAYCRRALSDCEVGEDTTKEVMEQIKWLLDSENCYDLTYNN